MRSASPKAAVDLPLPVPVWTMSRPFSTVLPATSASCTALRFSILARWRAALVSSTGLFMRVLSASAAGLRPSAPRAAAAGAMIRDARRHLAVERLRRRDVEPGRRQAGRDGFGMTALARAGAAEHQGQACDLARHCVAFDFTTSARLEYIMKPRFANDRQRT